MEHLWHLYDLICNALRNGSHQIAIYAVRGFLFDLSISPVTTVDLPLNDASSCLSKPSLTRASMLNFAIIFIMICI